MATIKTCAICGESKLNRLFRVVSFNPDNGFRIRANECNGCQKEIDPFFNDVPRGHPMEGLDLLSNKYLRAKL